MIFIMKFLLNRLLDT